MDDEHIMNIEAEVAVMTNTSLSQSSERHAHLLAALQRLYRQCVDFGAFFADFETFPPAANPSIGPWLVSFTLASSFRNMDGT